MAFNGAGLLKPVPGTQISEVITDLYARVYALESQIPSAKDLENNPALKDVWEKFLIVKALSEK